jgi:glycine cleavage system pyridoxal-binding protein P
MAQHERDLYVPKLKFKLYSLKGLLISFIRTISDFTMYGYDINLVWIVTFRHLFRNSYSLILSALKVMGALLSYPDTHGVLNDFSEIADQLHAHKGFLVVSADPLNLMLSKTPADMGADICVGSMQRFGVPMFSGKRQTERA